MSKYLWDQGSQPGLCVVRESFMHNLLMYELSRLRVHIKEGETSFSDFCLRKVLGSTPPEGPVSLATGCVPRCHL